MNKKMLAICFTVLHEVFLHSHLLRIRSGFYTSAGNSGGQQKHNTAWIYKMAIKGNLYF
ncbi:MAG: hypothetical protein H5T45_03660 [Thermoplasmatales archaeon]|nr:hypothetical protein [Thermoplasmatales archaeon]